MYSLSFKRRLYALQQIISSLIFAVTTFPQPIPLVFANSNESAFASSISSNNPSNSIVINPSIQSSSNNHHPTPSTQNHSTPTPITSASSPAQPTSIHATANPVLTTIPSQTVQATHAVSASRPQKPLKTLPAPPTITITGRTLSIFKSTHTLTDSDNRVARYGDKFLYGHNTPNVFGDLKHLHIGSRFTITENGKTNTYQIRYLETMTKSDTTNFMWAIVHADFRGKTYDLSLMTCAGAPRPNRDATHRLILFADRI